LLIPVALACFAVSPTAQAVSPPPDGGYPNNTTAEGDNALFSLTTGTDNTATGFDALYSNTTGYYNTANGVAALFSNVTGSLNTASGASTLYSNTTGYDNTASGFEALVYNTTGNNNTASGVYALYSNRTGNENTGAGAYALRSNTTGSNNIALGNQAGFNLTTGSANIDIGNVGVPAEGDTIRIGTTGTQTRTFIAGISGVPVPRGVGVIVGTNGQLGTIVSSERFKENIQPMAKSSETLLSLKPVTFHYKSDKTNTPQFGLVAEEVAAVNPDLIVRDKNGEIYSVRYEAVNAMLLNEFLKEHDKVEQLQVTVVQQREGFEAKLAKQQKQIEMLTAGLQKVSAQLEMSKAAPQTVLNGQ
jgi:hypothetical protein